LERTAKAGWEDGVPLTELLDRVHRVALSFLPAEDGHGYRNCRVKRLFTDRSFRHYQTLGCVDPPEKRGRSAHYGFRHFVQALLVRRLLWERVPAERIAVLMAGLGTEETKQLLLGGVEFVARAAAIEPASGSEWPKWPDSAAPARPETWQHVRVAPEVELHLREPTQRPQPEELEAWLRGVELAIRRHFR